MIYLKFYVKLFLNLSIPYGIVMGIFRYFSKGIVDWEYILFMGIGFGLFTGFALGTAHLVNVREELKQGHTTVLSFDSQIKTVTTNLAMMDIYNLLINKLGAKKITFNQDKSIITAKIGLSSQSWGETIKIILEAPNNSNQIYKIESKPKLFSTLVDFGKNIKNINQIIDIIKEGEEGTKSKRD